MKSLDLLVERNEEGHGELRCPALGMLSHLASSGSPMAEGSEVARLCVLGTFYSLRVPKGTRGTLVEVVSKPEAEFGGIVAKFLEGGISQTEEASEEGSEAGPTLVVKSLSSGRFYSRPAPDKAPFVAIGAVLKAGETAYLIEVMKTYSRVSLEPGSFPEGAVLDKVLLADGDDIEEGQALFELTMP